MSRSWAGLLVAAGLTCCVGTLARGAPPESATAEPASETVTLALVGHVVFGSAWPTAKPWLPDGDGTALVAEVADITRRADLAIGNLAVPLTEVGEPRFSRWPEHDFIMRTPPKYGIALRALGMDVMLTANNHALDSGVDGWHDSNAQLAALGIDSVGARGKVVIREIRGIRVGTIGFTQPYTDAFQAHTRIDEAAAFVAEVAPHVDVLVCYVHGGGEGADSVHVPHGPEYIGHEYRGSMVRLAHRLVDAGASIVVSVGAHHPRAMEYYRGRLISYGLGNFVTWGNFNLRSPNHLALALLATFNSQGALAKARLVPLRLKHPGRPFRDAEAWVVPFLRRVSRFSFPGTAPAFSDEGVIGPPE